MIEDDWDFYSLIESDEEKGGVANKIPGMGPSYSTELAIKICTTIASDTRCLNDICKSNPDFPPPRIIDRWRVFYPPFARNFNAAKKVQAQFLIDQLIELADNPENRKADVLNWSKTRITTRQWIAAKLLPKIYGDLITNENKNENAGNIEDIALRVSEINKAKESSY